MYEAAILILQRVKRALHLKDWALAIPGEPGQASARCERDARVGRRMLAIANALDEMSRATAAKLTGMDRQTPRDWVIRYNERGVAGA